MKILCIGRNYADHIAELQNERPSEPVIFLKPDTAVLQSGKPFFIPPREAEIHHEIELIFKVGKNGKFIEPRFAHKYISHVSLGIDFTDRKKQSELKAKGLPWELAKSFDNSAVIGNWTELDDIDSNFQFELAVNGAVRQRGDSKMMLWNVREIIAFMSQYFTLRQGDIIFTGTPSGVDAVRHGDRLTADLTGQRMIEIEVK